MSIPSDAYRNVIGVLGHTCPVADYCGSYPRSCRIQNPGSALAIRRAGEADAVFRIVQEALTNVHPYSGSRTARISLVWEDGNIRAEIQDTGVRVDSLDYAPAG